MTTSTTVPIGTLPVLEPGDDGWDAALSTFNLLDDLEPTAVAVPRSPEEVARAVRYAADAGLPVVVQATGHNASALGDVSGTLVVNTSRLGGVEIDVAARRVRVGAGVKWEAVTQQLSDLGLAGLHGSSPDVGIVGYSLGGGIGWLARKHGMQTNAVVAIEVVTADGVQRRVDADHDPDLFWALRGGNGNFGVVTAIEFAVFPVAQLYAGALFWPVERTHDVLTTWTGLLPTFPEELTTWVTVVHFPPDPALPDFARGQSLVVLMAAHLGEEAEGRALLEPFRRLGPDVDTLAVQPTIALGELAMDPVDPLPYRSTTALVDGLTPDAVAELSRIAGRGSDLALLQLRHGGGALHRVTAEAGARATLPGEVVVYALGVVLEPGAEPQVRAALDATYAAVAGDRVGAYPNFVEAPAETSEFFDAETWARLRRVKRSYDPAGLFRGNHPIVAD